MSNVYRECNFYNVIEYSSSVRIYNSVEEYGEIKKFDSLEDIFEKYIDVEFVKEWFGGKDWRNDKDIVLEDVYEERNGVGVMSVNEDMSLYIFKNDSLGPLSLGSHSLMIWIISMKIFLDYLGILPLYGKFP